jgi:hypothetical protein
MPNPDIPAEQLQRIQPVVEPLLADLRDRARELTPQSELALIYQLDASEAAQ